MKKNHIQSPDFFPSHLHIPGHSILVPDGRPFGVAGVSGFLKNGVWLDWLDWRGETWSMKSWDEDTELVLPYPYKTLILQWLGEEREHRGMEFSKDMHLQVQLWTTQHRKFGQQNDDAQTASRFVEAGQRQLEPKKLCHLIHLSAPWRLFLYWKTHVRLSCVENPVFGSWYSSESLQQGRVTVWYVLKSRSSEITHWWLMSVP